MKQQASAQSETYTIQGFTSMSPFKSSTTRKMCEEEQERAGLAWPLPLTCDYFRFLFSISSTFPPAVIFKCKAISPFCPASANQNIRVALLWPSLTATSQE